ncbi:MAG TPA: type II secretion system F family protein [Actinomycetota bacterium]|nr:type II secretion system F family protein [Actinomycetota bacterium]
MNVTFLAAIFVGAGLLMVVLGIAQRSSGRRQELRQLLEIELEEPTKSPEALSELMEKAGAYAERAMGKTSTAVSLRSRLTQAGSNLKAGEFMAIVAVAAAIVALLVGSLSNSVLVGVIFAAITPVAGMMYLKNKARKRLIELEGQLPAVLQLLAGSLDSGSSLLLALELAAEEGDAPLATELSRVIVETRVGRPLLESLEAMADRIGSKDISWTVEAIRIQHQTGGKLADTLRVLAEFMRARLEVRGEVRALSAEARISGKILIAMPIGIGLFLFFFRRGYLDPLLSTTMGQLMMGGAVIGMILGSLWMRKLVQVEV